MGYRWIARTGFLVRSRLGKPRLSRRQRGRSIGRAREHQDAVLGVIATATGRIVVIAAARFVAPAVKAYRIQHGEPDSHPREQQDGEKTKQSGRQGVPVPHEQHYHWYGASKSMFPSRVDSTTYPR